MGRLSKCSVLALHVPGYVPGLQFLQPLQIKGCSVRSVRSFLSFVGAHHHTGRAQKHIARDKYTRNTRNTWNKAVNKGLSDIPSPEHNPEHRQQARNIGKQSKKYNEGTING